MTNKQDRKYNDTKAVTDDKDLVRQQDQHDSMRQDKKAPKNDAKFNRK